MSLVDFLSVLHEVRTGRQIVVPTMGAAREWMMLGTHPLDFIYAPSAMGEAPPLGLGLALAQPGRQVIVLNGDGCQLMNLGCLVTISAHPVSNYVLIVCQNGAYEVTGNQATAASPAVRAGQPPVDFEQIARGCGFSQVFAFHDAAEWRRQVNAVLAAPGPTFVVWHVPPIPGGAVPKSPAPPMERVRTFTNALRQVP